MKLINVFLAVCCMHIPLHGQITPEDCERCVKSITENHKQYNRYLQMSKKSHYEQDKPYALWAQYTLLSLYLKYCYPCVVAGNQEATYQDMLESTRNNIINLGSEVPTIDPEDLVPLKQTGQRQNGQGYDANRNTAASAGSNNSSEEVSSSDGANASNQRELDEKIDKMYNQSNSPGAGQSTERTNQQNRVTPNTTPTGATPQLPGDVKLKIAQQKTKMNSARSGFTTHELTIRKKIPVTACLALATTIEYNVENIKFSDILNPVSLQGKQPWSEEFLIPGTTIYARYSKKAHCMVFENGRWVSVISGPTFVDIGLNYVEAVMQDAFDYGFMQFRSATEESVSAKIEIKYKNEKGQIITKIENISSENTSYDTGSLLLGSWYTGCTVISLRALEFCKFSP